jgi:hypothetical protein
VLKLVKINNDLNEIFHILYDLNIEKLSMRKYALLVVSLFKYLVASFKPLLNSLQTFFIPRYVIIH